jgi:succinyl-CoA synthetase beta subunit
VLDRANRRVILMASSEGGVDIEEVAAKTPDKIVKVAAHPFLGLKPHQARILADGIGFPRTLSTISSKSRRIYIRSS